MQNYETIIQRVWEDHSFKSEFINNPKSILKDLGYKIADSIKIIVHEDSSDEMNFVLLEQSQAELTNFSDDPVVGKVMSKAYTDAEFKGRLLSNPIAAVEEVLGIKPPPHIVIYENTKTEIHMVLPQNPETQVELSDADLALVAGGKGIMLNFNTVGDWMIKTGTSTQHMGESIRSSFGEDNPLGLMLSGMGPLMIGGGNVLQKTYEWLTRNRDPLA
ncbi:NHLP leader peptide family RiPP precursor [Deltaproteobacteria bacterium TL4]